MSKKPAGMTSYEDARWDEIQQWRPTAARSLTERLPANIQHRTKQAAQRAGEIWDKVPGNDALETALASAIKGGFHMAMDLTDSTINERKVVSRVSRGLQIKATGYDDIRGLDLAILDERAPKNARKRAALAAGHGAAAGFVAGGATAAGAATGGMGALPAAGIVALAIVADTAAVSVGSIQGAAYVGAHYGYDPTRPAERAMMIGLLAGTLAEDAAKAQALRQVRQLALDLAAKRAVQDLSEGALYNMMLRIYGALMLNTARRSIAKGVPILGAGIGATVNYHTVRRTIVSADHAYPERWLMDKYNATTVEIVDLEVVEAAVDAAVGAEDRGILDRLEHVDDVDESGT
jgi:EcsC protein family